MRNIVRGQAENLGDDPQILLSHGGQINERESTMLFTSSSPFDRAIRAYFRSFPTGPQPDRYSSGVEEHAGLTYAVLRNLNGVLQVCRVSNAGKLRRLIHWPRVLDE